MRLPPLSIRTVSLLAAVISAAAPVHGQTAATDPVGFTTIALPANSDTLVGLPLTRAAEFVGAVQSVSGNVITVKGTPGWATNQFVHVANSQPKTYFALIGPHATTNPREGHTFTIVANDINTLTVNLNGDVASDIVADTQISLIPYWTLATVFPATDVNVSFTASADALNLETQILLPDFTNPGIYLAPTATYFFQNGAWRKFGQLLSEDHGDDILGIHDYFVVRNSNSSRTLTALGGVVMKKVTTPLSTETNTQQDNFVSVTRPVDVMIKDLGLISSGAFVASNSGIDITDQLLVSDNTEIAINKAPSRTYFYFNGAWRKFGQLLTDDYGTDVIKSGSGFVVRKAPTINGATAFWINDKTY